MKILHLADLHIGKSFESKSLLNDQKFVLDQVLKTIASRKIEVMIIAGDVYDRSVPKEEAVQVYGEFIAKALNDNTNLRILVISGNHDSAIRLGQMSYLLKEMRYYVVTNFNKPIEKITLNDEFGLVDFYMMPYLDTFNIKKIYEIEDKDETEIYKKVLSIDYGSNRKVLVAHNFFNSSNPNDIIEESDSERLLNIGGVQKINSEILGNFNYIALGHLHKNQKVASENIRYCGTLLKYSLSELNHKKVMTIVDLKENGEVDLDFIPVTVLRDVVEISGYFNEIIKSDFYEKKSDFLSIKLFDDKRVEDSYSRLSILYPNIINLQYINIKEENSNILIDKDDLKQSTFDLFSSFFKNKTDRELSKLEDKIISEIIEDVEVRYDSN